ncbi:MAG: glutamate synthase subunit beta [Planctomycetes bacterium]|nr:glutamate synthase subunit beta [Planctomycetota bacterium]
MGKPTGFLEFDRELPRRRPVEERIRDWREIYLEMPAEKLREQGARCMDCGIPFCHKGCPLGNLIPDWNDLIFRNRWEAAIQALLSTNNFPEFTGRLCPAPCEEACVLGINAPPVTIKNIEVSIIDRAFQSRSIRPNPPKNRTGKTVAVIGSGPAGLACADQLNKAGHAVTVFERADRIGGLLRYGIPDFKMEKWVLDRRLKVLEEEGVVFRPGVNAGFDGYPADRLRSEFDAICIATGATKPRDLPVPGRELKGVYFAMEYLTQQNKVGAGDPISGSKRLSAAGKAVVILGGGDTGADCLGTAHRQGAKQIYQFELLPKPPAARTIGMPWPEWPMILRTSGAHEEGGIRDWSINTKRFTGKNGVLKKLHAVRVEFGPPDASGRRPMNDVPGTELELEVDLVLLALGFLGPEKEGLVADLGLKLDPRGNVATDMLYMSSVPGVFACGDARRGQSLIVWAISEGREAARGIDRYLMGSTLLPKMGAALFVGS